MMNTENRQARECIVCFDSDVEFSPEPLTSCCFHRPEMCVSCVAQIIRTEVKNPSNIRCRSQNCEKIFDYDDVRRGLGSDANTFTQYDEILYIKLLQRDENYVTCLDGRCGAGQFHMGHGVHGSGNYPVVICYKCGAKTCFKHRIAWHEGYTCEEWDARNEESTKGDILFKEWVATKAKRCPGCNNALEKKSGCNHFTCAPPGGCGHQFCWECLAPYVLANGSLTVEHNPPCKG